MELSGDRIQSSEEVKEHSLECLDSELHKQSEDEVNWILKKRSSKGAKPLVRLIQGKFLRLVQD